MSTEKMLEGYLERWPHGDGEQRLYYLENGFWVSMVSDTGAHFFPFAWEAAILDPNREVTYSTPLTTDVEVFLTDSEAHAFLEAARAWAKANPAPRSNPNWSRATRIYHKEHLDMKPSRKYLVSDARHLADLWANHESRAEVVTRLTHPSPETAALAVYVCLLLSVSMRDALREALLSVVTVDSEN